MAVTKVTESHEGRYANQTDEELATSRKFTVEFDTGDSPLARPLMARTARDPDTGLTIPPQGSLHPYATGMSVVRKTVTQGTGPQVFEVICEYSTKASTSGEKPTDPLKEKPQVSWTFVMSDEPVDYDINGKAILNSALEPFDPPVTKPVHDLVLRYVSNEREFKPLTALNYKGSINSDTFLGAPPGTAMCTVYDGEKIYDDKYGDYWRRTIEIQFRLEEVGGKKYGWKRRVLDQGYRVLSYYYPGDEPDWENITDDAGNQVSQPVPLDGTGDILKGSGKWPPDGVFLSFDLYKKVPFSTLNLKV